MSSGIHSSYASISMSSNGVVQSSIKPLSRCASAPCCTLSERFRIILGETEEPSTPKIQDIQPILPKEEPLYDHIMKERATFTIMNKKMECIGSNEGKAVNAVTLTCQAPDGQIRYFLSHPQCIIESCSKDYALIIQEDSDEVITATRDSELAQKVPEAPPCYKITKIQAIWNRVLAQFTSGFKDPYFLDSMCFIDTSFLSSIS